MKRIIKVWLAVLFSVLIICAASFACVAEETVTGETESITSESQLQAADEAEIKTENHTLLGRLEEYIRENKTDVLGVAGDAAIVVISVAFGLFQKSKTKKLSANVTRAVSAASGVSVSQNNMVGAVNTMIQSYNELKASYDRYGLVEAERNRIVGASVALSTATLEILSLVYTHNKNLPQGVKDIVTMKYANCLKQLEDDEKLAAIVGAVREGIRQGSTETPESPTEEA